MGKLGLPSIVISAPRVILTTALVAGIAAAIGTQYNKDNNATPSSRALTVSATQPATKSTSTPAIAEASPTVTPTPVPTAPRPATATDVPHSTTPAPVVTPAPDSSVTGLTPVNPTPASTTPSSNSDSNTTGGNTSTSTPAPATTAGYESTNWSGYLAATTNTHYTAVSGLWTVPAATATTTRTAYDAAWVGIGGVTSSDLIQVGTIDTVSNGHETSSAFYELLPRSATTITSLTVTPGDSMSASITQTATGQWSITITDTTTGKSFLTSVAYTSSLSSAEWIEEDPSTGNGSLLTLDTFIPVDFTGTTATANGTSITAKGGNAQPITLVAKSTHQPIATPSALGLDGQSFTVTRSQ